MRILEVYPNKRGLKIRVDVEDDLWVLKSILRPGDYVEGKTSRDIASGIGGEKERRVIEVKIRVKNIEFQPFTGRLRISGIIVEGPEKFGVVGKHHSMTIQPGSIIVIEREKGWSNSIIEKIKLSGPKGRALLIAIDLDEYAIALLSTSGFKILGEGSIKLPGKDHEDREKVLDDILSKIASNIVEATSKNDVKLIVVVGPGFIKDYLAEKIRTLMPSVKVYTDNTSMGGVSGLEEALRRQSTIEHLREFSIVEAENVLEEFMANIAKDPSRVAYGLEDVIQVSRLNALKTVVAIDSLLFSLDDSIREAVEYILREAEEVKAHTILIPEDSPPGEKIKRLGGIIAILRYSIPLEARQQLK
ncbi:MAG: pelota-like protein [Acidilobaceae archaeon]